MSAPRRKAEASVLAVGGNAGRTDIPWLCLRLMVLLVPLTTSNFTWLPGVRLPFTEDQIELPKVFILRALLLIAVAAWGWRFLRGGGTLRRTRVDWIVLAFLGWALLSTALSVHVPTALLGKNQRYEGLLSLLGYGLIFFLAVQVVDSTARRRALARTLIASSVIVALYGLLQYAGIDPLDWGEVPFGLGRSFSTYGNPDLLGGFLLLPLPLAAALALTESDRRWRPAYWAAFVVLMAVWVTTFTRGAWIGGFVGLSAFLVAAARGRVRPLAMDWAALAVSLAAATVFVVRSLSSSDSVTNALARVRSILAVGEGSAKTRFEIWQAAEQAIRARPLIGYGPDTFRLVFPQYKPAAYVADAGFLSVADNAHNYPLQLAAGLGIPGALLFYGVAGVTLWTATPRAFVRKATGDSLLLAGFWAACAGYLIGLMFGLSVPSASFLLWLSFGVLLAPTASRRRIEASRFGRAAALALVAVAVALSLGNLAWLAADHSFLDSRLADSADARFAAARRAVALNPFSDTYRSGVGDAYLDAGQYWLEQAQQQAQAGQDASSIQGLATSALGSAVTAYEEAYHFSPREVDNLVSLAVAYNQIAQWDPTGYQRALDSVQRGLVLDPNNPVLRLQAAIAHQGLGDLARATALAAEAVDLSPIFLEARALLGDLLARQGRRDEAIAVYRELVRLDPTNGAAVRALEQLETSAG